MHEINLDKYELRTDLVIDHFPGKESCSNYTKKVINKDIYVEEVGINNQEEAKTFRKKEGIYKTVTFKDISDSQNFKKVEEVFVNTLKRMLEENSIKEDSSVLIIGLKPGVTGETGIETKDSILAIVENIKPNFVIVIDALATSSIDRLNKTIQISNSGITPGSGVNNSRISIDKETLKVPVIVIGVPTIIDSSIIVADTINFMLKKFSYDKNNINNKQDKLKFKIDYKDYDKDLDKDEKKYLLGIVGTLSEDELQRLVFEVLNPIDYNYMVTPKEIDFLIDKLSLLIGHGLNMALHSVKRSYSDV